MYKSMSMSSSNVTGGSRFGSGELEEVKGTARFGRRPVRAVRPLSALGTSGSFLQINHLQGELVRKRKVGQLSMLLTPGLIMGLVLSCHQVTTHGSMSMLMWASMSTDEEDDVRKNVQPELTSVNNTLSCMCLTTCMKRISTFQPKSRPTNNVYYFTAFVPSIHAHKDSYKHIINHCICRYVY